MRKILASKKLRKKFSEAIRGGEPKKSLLDLVMTRGVTLIIQELLEQEVTDFLGREHYQRRSRSTEARRGSTAVPDRCQPCYRGSLGRV